MSFTPEQHRDSADALWAHLGQNQHELTPEQQLAVSVAALGQTWQGILCWLINPDTPAPADG